MTDKDNSQTGEYSYTYSYSYSKEGGEKNVEVHTGGFSAATAGEAAVDSTGKTTAGESSSGKSATGKATTIKSTTGKTTTRSRSTTTSSRSSTSPRSKNDNSGPDVGYWIMTAIFFATGLWPVGLIMLISKLSDPKRRKSGSATAKQAATKAGSAIQKVTQTPQYSAKSAKRMKIAGILLTIVGAVAFFNGVADNLFWLEDGFQLHYVKYFLEGLFYPTGLLAGGIGLLIGSGSMTRRHRRYASYLRIAGKRSSISVASLARAAEVSERRAERDLQAMLEKGLWGEEAYLDLGRGMLFRSHEAAEDQERQERQREAPQVPQEAEEGYSGMLRSIRRSNDRIADPELSRKIDRLEEIAGKILKLVEEDPAKKNQAATFLNYYLPTTEKLLDSYADFEEAGVSGENLTQAKEKIRRTMDSIMAGFERQLDALYHADAMDVDSDIRVMETMLRRDGGSVEEDFGLAVRRWPRRRICKGGRYVLPASSGCTGSTARKAFYKRPASLPVSCSMRRWVPKQKVCRRFRLCFQRPMILLFFVVSDG